MPSDLITIIVRAALVIVCAIVSWILTKYVKPWLEQNNLIQAADIAVKAAEAFYGRYNGDEKLKLALEQLKAKGFDIDSEEVLNAVKAAWIELNTAQIASGEKEVQEVETSEE